MLILVSNDDGIYAPGIQTLARHLKKIRNARVVVIAPDRERSAASHAITLHLPLRVEELAPDSYAVDGTPTDCIVLGVRQLLKKKPDLIVSGINRGPNIGEDVHYSGTVSAALEGAIMGIPAIAVSLVGRGQHKYEGAAQFAVKLAKKVLQKGLPRGVVLNVNIPDLPERQIKGCVFTKLGNHNYGDIIVQNADPRGRPYYWIGGNPDEFENREGTDCKAYLEKKISVTPIKVDLTDHHFLQTLKEWKI